jgi:DNA-binding beta-propeller fold protein YncE
MAFIPSADWTEAWITAPDEDKLLRLDLIHNTLLGEIAVAGEPHGLVLSPDGGTLYVTKRKLNQIAQLDLATGRVVRVARRSVKKASVGLTPDMLAISPDGLTLLATIRGDDRLLKLSTSDMRVLGFTATGDEPHGIAWRPEPEKLRAALDDLRTGKGEN